MAARPREMALGDNLRVTFDGDRLIKLVDTATDRTVYVQVEVVRWFFECAYARRALILARQRRLSTPERRPHFRAVCAPQSWAAAKTPILGDPAASTGLHNRLTNCTIRMTVQTTMTMTNSVIISRLLRAVSWTTVVSADHGKLELVKDHCQPFEP